MAVCLVRTALKRQSVRNQHLRMIISGSSRRRTDKKAKSGIDPPDRIASKMKTRTRNKCLPNLVHRLPRRCRRLNANQKKRLDLGRRLRVRKVPLAAIEAVAAERCAILRLTPAQR